MHRVGLLWVRIVKFLTLFVQDCSLARAYLYHDSNPYIKSLWKNCKLNLTSEARKSLHHLSSYWIILLVTVRSLFQLFIWARGLYFHPCPRLLALQHNEHMRSSRKVSNILRTSVKILRIVGILLKFSKTHRRKRSKTVSYTSFPQDLIGKRTLQPSPSWEVAWRRHDHFDWKK